VTGHAGESSDAAGHIHDVIQYYLKRCKHLEVVRICLYCLDPHDSHLGEPKHILHKIRRTNSL